MAKLVSKYQGEDIKINFKYRDKNTKQLINIDNIDELVVVLYSAGGDKIKQFLVANLTGSFTSSLSGSYASMSRVTEYEYYGWIESGETTNIQPGIVKSETKFIQYYPELSQSKLDTVAVADVFELVKTKFVKYVE